MRRRRRRKEEEGKEEKEGEEGREVEKEEGEEDLRTHTFHPTSAVFILTGESQKTYRISLCVKIPS